MRNQYKILILSMFVLACVNKKDGQDTKNPDAATGAMSKSLNRDQNSRLSLLGRTAAPTRYTEKIDDNRVRVVAINFGGVDLGQCADVAGNLVPEKCAIEGQEVVELEPTGSLTSGMVRQYSTQVGTTIEANVAIGPTSTNSTVYISRNFFIFEWRRHKLHRLEDAKPKDGTNYVSAVEEGIALRIIFDVTLRTYDADFSASFGIANISAAFARNEVTVEASYEILGSTLDPLPDKAVVITSYKEYLETVHEFYRIAETFSKASTIWQRIGSNPNYCNSSIDSCIVDLTKGTDRVAAPSPIGPDTFSPAQLAYYVTGVGVGNNYAKLRNIDACDEILARHQYLKEDFIWHKAALEHHQQNRARLSQKGKRMLLSLEDELREIQAEQRDLAAEAGDLACVQTCEADRQRHKEVCSMSEGDPTVRKELGCDAKDQPSCQSSFSWEYDATVPLQIKRTLTKSKPKR